ncbi:ABC transporter permease subunit [Cellulomonas denverensis]|uniref:ABC transporter permease subunit n=1 Tax=Cellulomonas denverensis TaxID=264297 RepID=A0A7X6QYX3_9CELL|nr:ABC transporter permease subunit [Cellulomonas denverensis]NKY22583.1 ABC transporter permease subunit [Cellulomonas denverensis]GIG24772.1 ABC transporter permease [Cellulomonas denverensis]
MIDTLRAEYRKLVTTRIWWVLVLAMVVYMAFIAGVMGVALTLDPESSGMTTDMPTGLDDRTIAITIYTLAASLGFVFPLLVGVMSVTGEFRHHTITPTLLAEPNRTRLIVAKMLASVPLGLLFGLAGAAATTGTGAGVLAVMDHSPMLGDGDVLAVVGRTVLALTVWCVLGVGLGCVLTNQVLAIVVVLAFTQFVEPVARLLFGQVDALSSVGSFLPGAAGEAISGGSFYTQAGAGDLLPGWAGALVLIGYALLFAVIGRLTTFRRDIS